MIPMERASAPERRLLKILRALNAQDRAALMAFAEFLMAGGAGAAGSLSGDRASAPATEPQQEARPPQESVVAAIKRLRRVYPMLDPGEMLHETSALMAAHLLQGRDAAAVIDELEVLFVSRYQTQLPGISEATGDDAGDAT
ncbi:MAG: hypothetical protein VBE63_01770 [Lamprobacter sp.]|uniref:hypothetical protein n=1 Tax=Lamprobacter sp. TaxID=3100796 RepID=UPI002B25C2B7|nr:hypothetical protein [Lamprobacter sp.]MEA3638655.1 hypothetical protein [Lamprobacter sp.]